MTKLKQQTYNKEFLDNLKNELKNIDNFTIDDSILYLKSDLITLQNKGYSTKIIHEILQKKGLKISLKSLTQHLQMNN